MLTSADILRLAVHHARKGLPLRMALSRAATDVEDARRHEFTQAQCTAIERVDYLVARAAREGVDAIELLDADLRGALRPDPISKETTNEFRRALKGAGNRLRRTGS